MSSEDSDPARDAPAARDVSSLPDESSLPGASAHDASFLRAAIDDALAAMPDADDATAGGEIDPRSLGIGIRLGLMRPREAMRMLKLIQTGNADLLTAADATTSAAGAGASTDGAPGDADQIPVSSMLLVRAASLSGPEASSAGPASRFGWATRLTRSEVLSMGGVVEHMIARGASRDIARGFGLAWDAGARLPRDERDALLAEFVELEVTVAEVLTGRDLRETRPAPRPTGLAGLFSAWLGRSDPGDGEASAAIEQGGEPARMGLIALWNAWTAARFRSLISRSTFELLTEPWVTVVGPLPEP
jgi:hypothetical protein